MRLVVFEKAHKGQQEVISKNAVYVSFGYSPDSVISTSASIP